MRTYSVKTPRLLKFVLSGTIVWDMPKDDNNSVYLTFDDGPHPTITPFILEQLHKYDAKATFFCVGNNVAKYNDVYKKVLEQGHSTGNHTYNHLNGWKTSRKHYLKNINQAAKHIKSYRFRPPYGRIKISQYSAMKQHNPNWKVYMWDVLSGDFDTSLSWQDCSNNVIKNIKPGSIVVFHDSEKAWPRLEEALPVILDYCKKQGLKPVALP